MQIPETTKEQYLTGHAALNIPYPGVLTGDWHFVERYQGCFGREPGPFAIAGRDWPSTNNQLGDYGIIDAAEILKKFGAHDVPSVVYAASHYRAYVDLLIRMALKYGHCRPFPLDDYGFNENDAKEIEQLLTKASILLPEDTTRSLLTWFKQQSPSPQPKNNA